MDILQSLYGFYKKYGGVKGIMGYSYLNKPIYFFEVYKTAFPVVIVQYGIHAREYITTYLAIKQIKDFTANGKVGTVYFVPAVNPDGIEIALNSNPLFKANARGVDLNVNFDAKWGRGEKNIRNGVPDKIFSENYIGAEPFSEKESVALRDFTILVKPNLTISYHSKGEEIYWDFDGESDDLNRDLGIARVIEKSTGYAVKNTVNSCGGYKDWCILKLKIPAVTVEVGNDGLSHPIKAKSLKEIYLKNKNVLFDVTEHFGEENGNKIYENGD